MTTRLYRGVEPGTSPRDGATRGILNNARGDMSVQSEEAIRQLVRAVVDAWNVHDAGAFAAAFDDEADFTNVLGMHTSGREAIERFHRAPFGTRFRNSRLTATATTVRRIRDEVAAVDVHWEMIGARHPHDNELPPAPRDHQPGRHAE